MIIIPSKKFIFLRVPKTASTSVSQFFGEKMQHIDDMRHTPVLYSNFYTDKSLELGGLMQPHINLYEMLHINFVEKNLIDSCRVFGVIRDPVERFISCANAMYLYNKDVPGGTPWLSHITEVQKRTSSFDLEHLASETLDYFKNIDYIIFRKQCFWLMFEGRPISDIFLYQELNKLTTSVFNYLDINNDDSIPYSYRSNERPNKNFNISKELRTRIIEHYWDDYELYQRMLTK